MLKKHSLLLLQVWLPLELPAQHLHPHGKKHPQITHPHRKQIPDLWRDKANREGKQLKEERSSGKKLIRKQMHQKERKIPGWVVTRQMKEKVM